MNSFYEHHKECIKFRYGCFDRILLNACIQPFLDGARTKDIFGFIEKSIPSYEPDGRGGPIQYPARRPIRRRHCKLRGQRSRLDASSFSVMPAGLHHFLHDRLREFLTNSGLRIRRPSAADCPKLARHPGDRSLRRAEAPGSRV
jgi:hypothetical protein